MKYNHEKNNTKKDLQNVYLKDSCSKYSQSYLLYLLN